MKNIQEGNTDIGEEILSLSDFFKLIGYYQAVILRSIFRFCGSGRTITETQTILQSPKFVGPSEALAECFNFVYFHSVQTFSTLTSATSFIICREFQLGKAVSSQEGHTYLEKEPWAPSMSLYCIPSLRLCLRCNEDTDFSPNFGEYGVFTINFYCVLAVTCSPPA